MQWHDGPARHFRVADGLSAGLASRRVPRDDTTTQRADLACIAAYGDAVVPRITQAIANAIRRTELMLAAA